MTKVDDGEDPERADKILAEIRRGQGTHANALAQTPKSLDDPRTRRKRALADEAELSVTLQKRLANWAIRVMIIQIGLADLGFAFYGFANTWHIPPAAIIGWLSATVVEVIGLVLVITQRLFPTRKPRR